MTNDERRRDEGCVRQTFVPSSFVIRHSSAPQTLDLRSAVCGPLQLILDRLGGAFGHSRDGEELFDAGRAGCLRASRSG